jgi:hypothetical protein
LNAERDGDVGDKELDMRVMAAILTGIMLIGATTPPAERVVSGDGTVAARIAGVPTRLRIDPAAPAMPLIDRALAERAKLKLEGSWGISIGYAVGGTAINTRTQSVPIDLDTHAGKAITLGKRRIGWASRAFATGVDASAGPAAMPEPVVRFQLHAPRPGETTTTFPARHDTVLFGMLGDFSSTFAEIMVGGAPMRLRLDPYHARSLVTAGAAARLAAAQGGTLSGEVVPTEIFFGVVRPVRTMTFARPLVLGPLSIPTLGVRIHDAGRTGAIPDANAPAAPVDPDEIVVTGKGGKRDIRRDTLSLGADYLARCSSIVFDKPAKVIRLTCA